MKGFQITFLIILSCTLSTQAIRHVHQYIYGYEESIIAPVEEFFEMKEEIRLEASTDELLAEYEVSQEAIRQLRESDSTKELFQLRQENGELFARNSALRTELQERESMARELRDIWIFSIAGFILIGLGSLFYSRGNEWVGMSLILPGFLELTYWSSPSFSLGGALQEYELLLVNKIILTIIAFVLLFSLWLVSRRKWKKLEGNYS
jgi:hypothetical protein